MAGKIEESLSGEKKNSRDRGMAEGWSRIENQGLRNKIGSWQIGRDHEKGRDCRGIRRKNRISQ